jgi:hypothetical protein
MTVAEMTTQGTDTSVLVVSCDKYRDLWVPFFTLFFRYWPDCPYQIYLCSNETSYEDKRVKTILAGPDRSWSSNLKRCLEELPTEYFIIFQEDFLFTKRVNTGRIDTFVQFLKEQEAACLRLMPFPPPETLIDDNLQIGEISRGAPYRVSLQTAIWNKSVLYELLKEGESPWDLENMGSFRSNSIDRSFLSITKKNRSIWPLDYFGTAIVQGKWVRQAITICTKEGIPVNRTKRAVESRFSPLQRIIISRLRSIKAMLQASIVSHRMNRK